jgi:hypothetical protein
MLSRVLFRRVAAFSKLFYQPSVLEYPVNRHDEATIKNKALMDEVNGNFLNILKKVCPAPPRPLSRPTRKSSINFTKKANFQYASELRSCWTQDHPSWSSPPWQDMNCTARRKSTPVVS